MPIGIDEFEEHDPDESPTNAERVLAFLARNPEKAFKAAEIAAATGVDGNSIHPVLNRLEERKLVRHKEPYWALGAVDAVRDAMAYSATARFLDEELGAERRDEWVDPASENPERDE